MSRWKLIVEVDEDELRKAVKETDEAGEMDKMSVEDMIWQEMGWVGQLGMHVVELKPENDDTV